MLLMLLLLCVFDEIFSIAKNRDETTRTVAQTARRSTLALGEARAYTGRSRYEFQCLWCYKGLRLRFFFLKKIIQFANLNEFLNRFDTNFFSFIVERWYIKGISTSDICCSQWTRQSRNGTIISCFRNNLVVCWLNGRNSKFSLSRFCTANIITNERNPTSIRSVSRSTIILTTSCFVFLETKFVFCAETASESYVGSWCCNAWGKVSKTFACDCDCCEKWKIRSWSWKRFD